MRRMPHPSQSDQVIQGVGSLAEVVPEAVVSETTPGQACTDDVGIDGALHKTQDKISQHDYFLALQALLSNGKFR